MLPFSPSEHLVIWPSACMLYLCRKSVPVLLALDRDFKTLPRCKKCCCCFLAS